MSPAARIFLGHRLSQEIIDKASLSTLVSIGAPARDYTSFTWRLVLSAVIATGGIAVSSSATVIGAMLIAPLMSPMLGTTLAIALGNNRAALRTFLITVVGAAACVGVSVLVAAATPVGIDTSSNAEVLSRASPRLTDLIIALASGLMAAIAVLREDIPDALPGVAIAAAIVPPLCVVGCSLYAGDLSAASGAFLLFLANYFAIQITSVLFFLAAGVASFRSRHAGQSRAKRIAWIAAIAVGVVLVSTPLTYASIGIIKGDALEAQAKDVASEWLEGSGYRISSIKVDNDRVSVEIAGTGAAPETSKLKSMLEDEGMENPSLRVRRLHEESL